MKYITTFILFILLNVTCIADGNWPDFRGPNHNGITNNTTVPLSWDETKNIKWKTAIDGRGHSSPVIWENQIWFTTALEEGKTLYAICIDKTNGEILFKKALFHNDTLQETHELNSLASPSPVIEHDFVYLHFGTYGTACINTKTFKTIWQRTDINCDHMVGPGSSPILYKNLIIVHVDGGDVQYVIALDKKTGKTKWKTNRSYDFGDMNPDWRKAFATSLITNTSGQDELISPGAYAVYSYNPDNGKEIWKVH
jgi:outer membrane protein assembly factor BamB